MKTIGEKITEIRKRKGLTQEELSDKAGINLRTLQRIEKGETTPHGHTARVLCDVLEMNIEDLLDFGKVEDKKFLIYFHLSTMVGMVIPLGDIIVPLILWLVKKDKIISLNEQGINLLNFRINWTIAFYLFLCFFFNASFSSPILIVWAQVFTTVLYPIFIAISIHKRDQLKLYYPGLIKIIR